MHVESRLRPFGRELPDPMRLPFEIAAELLIDEER